MRSNYYEMKDAKVRIARELMERGWEVLGFKEDESDVMTDYFSPADWDGVAKKNGFILCVDTPYSAKSTPIEKRNYDFCLSQSDLAKIKKLEALTQDRGATAGEEANAKMLIEKIKNSKSDTPEYEIIGYTTAHMANPGRCKWHIEKDGSLYDKGTGITKYREVPESYIFNIDTMQFKDNYKKWRGGEERTLSDEKKKIINDFKKLILRWERTINNMNSCGDGTAETEQEGLNQQENEKMQKVIKKQVKKVLKMVEVKRENNLQINDIFWENGYGNLKVISIEDYCYKVVKIGKGSRGFKESRAQDAYSRWTKVSVNKAVQNGKKVYNIVEVEEVIEVEKWVRVKSTSKATTKTTKKTSKIDNSKETKTTVKDTTTNTTSNNITATVNLNNDKNGIEISFTDKPEPEIRNLLKANGFRWSKYNKIWFAKQSDDTINFANELANKLNDNTAEPENTNDPVNTDKIEQGYVYDCHFKEWNFDIDEIHTKLNELNIDYVDMGNKVGFNDISYETILKIENLNNENGSVLFIDNKKKDIYADITITDEDITTSLNLLDYSTDIIVSLKLNNETYADSTDYKNKLIEVIKEKQLKINLATLKYLHDEGYEVFEGVLKSILNNEAKQTTTTIPDPKTTNYPEININDIETYTVDPKLSKRENDNSMFRRIETDHQKQLQDLFKEANNDILELIKIEGCTDYMIFKAKQYLQSFKKNYYNLYIRILNHRVNNPSWMVTGRGNLNVHRYNKKQDQLFNMENELCGTIDKFNNKIEKIKNTIYKNKETEQLKNLMNRMNTIDDNDLKQFKKVKVNINAGAVRNIFTATNGCNMREFNAYKLDNSNYYIIKSWGAWRIYDKQGNEIFNTNTLKDAKKYVLSELTSTETAEAKAI